MSEAIRVEKPSAELYKGKRKVYCISLLYSEHEAPTEYLELIDEYWTQVEDQVQKMEKAGRVSKIYHEAIYSAGNEGLKELEKLNEKSYTWVKRKCEEGAALESLEDRDLFFEFVDWKRCMMLPFTSQNVMNKVFEFYTAASSKRYEYLAQRIDETLEEDETGLLIMNDEDRSTISFPQDIEIFIVHPPALTDIQRWIREQLRRGEEG
jgi:frataxin-like iron-binding protein CyaY